MMRAEAAGSLVAFGASLFDLRTVLLGLSTREYFWAREFWGPGEDGAIRLRRTDRRSTRAPLGVDKLSGRMGASTRSCHGEAGEPGASCGPGEVRAILSLEADRPALTPRPLGSWGVAIRELTATDSSLPASDFLGVDSSSDGAGDGVRAEMRWLTCCSALWRSLTPISTLGTILGFLVSEVGDSGMGEAEAMMAAAAAAAAARVTRRMTAPFSPATSCSTLSLLIADFLRDNLLKPAEQRLRGPSRAGGTQVRAGAPVSPRPPARGE